jgi:hypothetical protein
MKNAMNKKYSVNKKKEPIERQNERKSALIERFSFTIYNNKNKIIVIDGV